MYLGIDDTDSNKGMCTTYLAALIIEELQKKNIALRDYPALVRLNPNIPWKTRGNGALAMDVGSIEIEDKKVKKKKIGDRYYIYEGDDCSVDDVFEIVRSLVERYSCFEDEKTNPGFVISEKKPSRHFYERCVRDVVDIDEALHLLENIGAVYEGYKNGRGLIGATAAIAYEPLFSTYEILAYRKAENTGTGKKRFIDRASLIDVDRRFPETFDNYDYENDHICIAPNSPCPVLFGVRGISPELSKVLDVLRTEEIERWIIYRSNQATDEHLTRKSISEMKEHTSGIIEGFVRTKPEIIEGGHVLFEITDGGNAIACAAYEPTKQFRNIVLKLMPGDRVELYGGMNKYDTFNIEKMQIKSTVKLMKNPECCGKSMKSMGKGKGFRCEKCGKKVYGGKMEVEKRGLKPGFYEVPPCARRHLSMPLKVYNYIIQH